MSEANIWIVKLTSAVPRAELEREGRKAHQNLTVFRRRDFHTFAFNSTSFTCKSLKRYHIRSKLAQIGDNHRRSGLVNNRFIPFSIVAEVRCYVRYFVTKENTMCKARRDWVPTDFYACGCEVVACHICWRFTGN